VMAGCGSYWSGCKCGLGSECGVMQIAMTCGWCIAYLTDIN